MFERKTAPYLFHGQTVSLCETCLAPVPAKVILEGQNVYYLKRCRSHGVQKALISTDAAYWKSCLDWLKPSDRPAGPADPHRAWLPLRLRPLP
jgi:7,8-dihydro-6-hydroxymethylpterin dimethyltransferase